MQRPDKGIRYPGTGVSQLWTTMQVLKIEPRSSKYKSRQSSYFIIFIIILIKMNLNVKNCIVTVVSLILLLTLFPDCLSFACQSWERMIHQTKLYMLSHQPNGELQVTFSRIQKKCRSDSLTGWKLTWAWWIFIEWGAVMNLKFYHLASNFSYKELT